MHEKNAPVAGLVECNGDTAEFRTQRKCLNLLSENKYRLWDICRAHHPDVCRPSLEQRQRFNPNFQVHHVIEEARRLPPDEHRKSQHNQQKWGQVNTGFIFFFRQT